jgi:predicted ATPase
LGIAGEPGVGKSRLLSEFRESPPAREVDYVEGRCLSHGSSIPYLPILDLLRRDWRITDGDTSSGIAAKVHRRLEDLGMDPATTAPYLLWLLGVRNGADRISHLSPEALKRRAFDALRGLLLERSRRGALILALEDLHWIDKASEEFLGSLMDAVSGASILFLATYRPGYRPPWIERSYVTQLALPLLSAHDSTTVVRSFLSKNHVPDQVVGSIVARADGNPFFLEELARALAVDLGLGPP